MFEGFLHDKNFSLYSLFNLSISIFIRVFILRTPVLSQFLYNFSFCLLSFFSCKEEILSNLENSVSYGQQISKQNFR
ncbi:unnamed protein product [Trichobilharzia szidati]|nr:unnamed protein product [Trichobilharzia szidati]